MLTNAMQYSSHSMLTCCNIRVVQKYSSGSFEFTQEIFSFISHFVSVSAVQFYRAMTLSVENLDVNISNLTSVLDANLL